MRRTLVASAAALAVVGVTACQPSLELTSSALPDASIAQIGLVDAITRDAPPVRIPDRSVNLLRP